MSELLAAAYAKDWDSKSLGCAYHSTDGRTLSKEARPASVMPPAEAGTTRLQTGLLGVGWDCPLGVNEGLRDTSNGLNLEAWARGLPLHINQCP